MSVYVTYVRSLTYVKEGGRKKARHPPGFSLARAVYFLLGAGGASRALASMAQAVSG